MLVEVPNASTGAATTNGPVYSYTAAGRLKTRSWVRTVAGGARLLTTYKQRDTPGLIQGIKERAAGIE